MTNSGLSRPSKATQACGTSDCPVAPGPTGLCSCRNSRGVTGADSGHCVRQGGTQGKSESEQAKVCVLRIEQWGALLSLGAERLSFGDQRSRKEVWTRRSQLEGLTDCVSPGTGVRGESWLVGLEPRAVLGSPQPMGRGWGGG